MAFGTLAGGLSQGISSGVNIGLAVNEQKARREQEKLTAIQEIQQKAAEQLKGTIANASGLWESALKKADSLPPEEAQKLIADTRKTIDEIMKPSALQLAQGLQLPPEQVDARFQSILNQPTPADLRAAKAKETAAVETAKAEVGQQFPSPTSGQQKVAVSPDGKTVRRVVFDPITKKTTFEDGTPVPEDWIPYAASTQLTGEESGLTSKAKGLLEEKLINIGDTLANLDATMQSFDPKFLELPTQAKVGALKLGSKLGIDLSPENKKLVEDAAVFFQDAITGLNSTIKAMTGAQMSEKEAVRLRKQVPDPEKDDPTTFYAKLKNSVKITKLANARALFLRKNGVMYDFNSNDEPPISIRQFESMIEARGKELMEDEGMTREQALGVLKEEFNL